MQWHSGRNLKKTEAIAVLARKAVSASPGHVENWLMLGNALIVLGEFREAATSLRQAVEIAPSVVDLRILLVAALTSLDLQEEALQHAEVALTLAPNRADAKFYRLEILSNLKRWTEAEADADLSVNPRMMQQRTKSLKSEEALAVFDRQLADHPGHTNATYLKAITLAAMGRAAEARKLIALDKHLEVSELPAPPGYDDAQSFRDALAQEIRANPTLLSDPRGKPLRDGLRTSRLSIPGAIAVDALLSQIKRSIDAYVERLEALGDDFVRGQPKAASLKSWAVIYGSDGRQKSHRHPGGWLSGVYFVSAPRPHGENAHRGPLMVGELDPEFGIDPPWGARAIEPVPGRLVLFPSYVPHATEPTGIDGSRIIVAFDVVPVEDGNSAGGA